MKLLYGSHPIVEFGAGTVATIGNFDGVHRGHQELLSLLRREAMRKNLPLLVVLFEPQPGEYFLMDRAPVRLSSLREKIDALRNLGVDYVYCLRFNHAIAAMPCQAFATQYIFSLFQMKYILIGSDFRFGHQRLGDVSLLKTMGSERGCVVEHLSDVAIDGQRVSSTLVRQMLQVGNLPSATSLLGRTYSLCGRVVRGDGRGRQWGFPTANVSLAGRTLPLTGVYFVHILRSGKPKLQGIANLGCRPTVDGQKSVLEVHLFDFQESLYGERIQVFFIHKWRDEKRFDSVDALIATIANDIVAAKAYFAEKILTNF